MKALSRANGEALDAPSLAARIGQPEKAELVYKLANHLAANGKKGIAKSAAKSGTAQRSLSRNELLTDLSPNETRYCLFHTSCYQNSLIRRSSDCSLDEFYNEFPFSIGSHRGYRIRRVFLP